MQSHGRVTPIANMKAKLVSFLLAAGSLLLAVPSFGQFTISSVPLTISVPGTYTVRNNLAYTATSGNAITVNSDDVTIDFNGYYLSCPVFGNTKGIYVKDVAEVSVIGGKIVGFQVGCWFEGSAGSSLNFGQLVDGVRFRGNSFAVYFIGSKDSVVKNCQFYNSSTAIAFIGSEGNRAVGNTISHAATGCVSDGPNYLESNYINACLFGIYATSAAAKLRFNTTTNCTAPVIGGTSTYYLDE
jgi:parallel beta-helix repeat protein